MSTLDEGIFMAWAAVGAIIVFLALDFIFRWQKRQRARKVQSNLCKSPATEEPELDSTPVQEVEGLPKSLHPPSRESVELEWSE